MRFGLLKCRVSVALLGLLMPLASGCGDDDEDAPANVAGDYSINLTNRENGCQLQNWQEGESVTSIPFIITQDGRNIQGTVEGVAGLFFNAAFGTNQFVGTASGNDLTMTLISDRSQTEGNCVYTLNASIHGMSNGDVLTGTIDYTKATNDNPDCAGIEGCVSRQEFNGARPPM